MQQLGSVTYNYLGADGETLSKVTELAGRDESYLVPTSVSNSVGEMLYIFRKGSDDELDHSEILLADGSASPVAELLINYKGGSGGKIKSVSVNFKGENIGNENVLILGVAITLVNCKRYVVNYFPFMILIFTVQSMAGKTQENWVVLLSLC
jgi:hypothetical protein